MAKAPPAAFSATEIEAADEAARRRTAELDQSAPGPFQRPITGYNHVILDGQSLAAGWDSRPIRTVEAPDPANLMLGGSVHSSADRSQRWVPVGEPVFTPLAETVVGPHGETVLSQALLRLRAAMVAAGEVSGCQFVASQVGYGGRTIEMLSKGARNQEYRRIPGAARAVRNAAAREGGAYALAAFIWIQGEHNYLGAKGSTTDRQVYKDLFAQLVADIRADCQYGIAQQDLPFPTFLCQSGSQYTVDATGLSIGLAQWDISREQPHCYLVTPTYPFPDHGGHLTANGEAWMGQLVGKAMARVIVEQKPWRPLAPLSLLVRDAEILISYDVPCPPLVFRDCYYWKKAMMFPTRGFRVFDDEGFIAIRAVEIVAPRVIRIRLARATSAAAHPTVRYAGQEHHKSHRGHGNVCDSDATVASATYVFDPASDPKEDIAELVDRPYPLWNWSIAFQLPAEAAP